MTKLSWGNCVGITNKVGFTAPVVILEACLKFSKANASLFVGDG